MNAEQARRLAAVAGVLVVISIFAGGFAEGICLDQGDW
jgi:hypothetical protein